MTRGSSGRDERGDALVIWCLGMALVLLPLGGVSLDLWHSISVERTLQSAASSAAAAGSSGVDQSVYRQTGSVTLDPGLAEALVSENLADQTALPSGYQVSELSVDGNSVTVQLKDSVGLTLLRLLVPGGTVHLTATAKAEAAPSGAP
ncbi:MAG TPA: hypothetical protein VMU63_03965 [Acidimicrobiales bacterium]|nr:hypothetical protein [Acidimicrobiales bacterium]